MAYEKREQARGEPPPVALGLRLTLFVLGGAAAALVLWHTLNYLLAGQLPESPAWLIGAFVVLLAAVVAGLSRFVRRLGGSG